MCIRDSTKTGKNIRPIALFQAQPKGKEDATTFEKLRDKRVDKGIPAEQIAIRTADVNELKNTDLMSPSCPKRNEPASENIWKTSFVSTAIC